MVKQILSWWQEYLRTKRVPSRDEAAATMGNPPDLGKRFTEGPESIVAFTPQERLKMPHLLTATSTLKRHERADWQHTDTRIRQFAALFLERARREGVPLYVHSAFRTKLEQADLYHAGRSKALWPKASHCQGKAVDIVHAMFHWDMSKAEWSTLGKMGKDLAQKHNIPITWGGDWSFYDPAHWEIRTWKEEGYADLVASSPERITPRGLLNKL